MTTHFIIAYFSEYLLLFLLAGSVIVLFSSSSSPFNRSDNARPYDNHNNRGFVSSAQVEINSFQCRHWQQLSRNRKCVRNCYASFTSFFSQTRIHAVFVCLSTWGGRGRDVGFFIVLSLSQMYPFNCSYLRFLYFDVDVAHCTARETSKSIFREKKKERPGLPIHGFPSFASPRENPPDQNLRYWPRIHLMKMRFPFAIHFKFQVTNCLT